MQKNNKIRIMVDMSATLIHHGHTRLLKKAAEHGTVVVGLTTDDEIIKKKGYTPELAFKHRKEILEAIKYVDEVVPTPWLINNEVLDSYKIDLLVHGDDNSNLIDDKRLLIFPRTTGVSSSDMRTSVMNTVNQINNKKLMLTPGPAAILAENIVNIKPLFGRGDAEYTNMHNSVISWIKDLSAQDEVITSQGSATFSLELAARSFVSGKVLLISTGYYSDRLQKFLGADCNISICNYQDLNNVKGNFDWVMCAYTETSIAFKVDLSAVKNKADKCGAKLFVDATGSIGLEDGHHLADVMAFSSCKGLFGLTGASFIAHKSALTPKPSELFYFNMLTHKNKMTTGPYHAIASLFGVIKKHNTFKQRMKNSKDIVMHKWPNLIRDGNQPLLCTYLDAQVIANDDNVVLYTPRSELDGSVICHLGEIHHDNLNITNRINIKC